jgi:hypothetical protein
MAISGSSFGTIIPLIGYEIIDGLLVLFAGYLLVILFERLARKTGKLEEY